jgi:hypothetical protein
VVRVHCVSDGAWRVLVALVSRRMRRKKHSPARTAHAVSQEISQESSLRDVTIDGRTNRAQLDRAALDGCKLGRDREQGGNLRIQP